MKTAYSDRLKSILAYFTFGIFSIVWIVFANVSKKPITPYLSFNLYQAIFISIVFAVISLLYSIAINLLSVVPIIGNLAKSIDIALNQPPLYFTCTITGLITTLILWYISFLCLLGKKPYVPFISDIIKSNFGE